MIAFNNPSLIYDCNYPAKIKLEVVCEREPVGSLRLERLPGSMSVDMKADMVPGQRHMGQR